MRLLRTQEKQHPFFSSSSEPQSSVRQGPKLGVSPIPTASQPTAHRLTPVAFFLLHQQLDFQLSTTTTGPTLIQPPPPPPPPLPSPPLSRFQDCRALPDARPSKTSCTSHHHHDWISTRNRALSGFGPPSQMASFRLAHSFARRPLGRPLQPCTGNPPKSAGRASFGSGRVDRSLYDNLRSAMADYLAEDMTSTTPPGPHKFDEPGPPTLRRVISYKRGLRVPRRESPAEEVSKGRPPRTIQGFRPSRTYAPKTDTAATENMAHMSVSYIRFSAGRLFGIRKARLPDRPLRILFCGSDEFSCVSLQALYSEFFRSKKMIRSIDVVVRPAKPVGRGLKEMREGMLS